MRLWIPRVIFAALAFILLLEVITIAPRLGALTLVACACWMAVPGVVLADRLFRPHTTGHVASWLVGPALGLGVSGFGLLLCWAAGLQNWFALLLAPVLTWVVVLAAGRWGGPNLWLPRFDRRDITAVGFSLLIVPLVTFAPYDHVREPTADGEAYRAYFTADFVWAMAVTAELAKGDVPPVNPFLRGEPLRYYWMSHLLSGALYRNLRSWGVRAEEVILMNGLAFGLVFVAFLYGLARMAGGNPVFSALAVIVAFAANSYEGLDRILVLREYERWLDNLRAVNIDAVTRWFYQGMPVDGLQRMLLYQPHHLTGYMLALSALWLVGFAEDVTEVAVALWAGLLLGLAFLFSTFTAIVVGAAIGVLLAVRLAARRAWTALWQAAILGGMPVIVAVATSSVLGYTDPEEGLLIDFGLNPIAAHRWPLMLFLSFGPLLFAGLAGPLRPGWIRRDGAAAAALVASALAFYFLADVPGADGVWVGWRTGHLLLIAFAVIGAAGLTAAWRFPSLRVPLVAVSVLVILPAVPTVAIDVYNAQDITNRGQAATFPWTLIITPPEREALEWIRRATPPDATVQTGPEARHSGTWAYVPAFAERRMAAGLPGSMIPFRPYRLATDNVTFGIFRASKARDAWEMGRFLGIDYLLVGEPERDKYKEAVELLASDPTLFRPAFHNDAVTVYELAPR